MFQRKLVWYDVFIVILLLLFSGTNIVIGLSYINIITLPTFILTSSPRSPYPELSS